MKKYKFSFKYPNNWDIESGVQVQGVRQFSLTTENKSNFFVTAHGNIVDLDKWLKDNQAGKIVGTKKIGEYNFSIIQGGLLSVSREYALVYNNNLLRFVIEPEGNITETDKIFDQILSTFKFTN